MLKMVRTLPLLIALMAVAVPRVGAGPEDNNVIVGTAWGITLSADGTGFYNDVLYGVLTPMSGAKFYMPQPYNRAKSEFRYHKDNCIYPAGLTHLRRGNELEEGRSYIETVPLIFVESHIFARPGTAALGTFEDLAGKRVAYPNGSALPTVLDGYGAIFIPTTDEMTKANMLLAGRVDFMSGSLPDNIFVFQQMGEPLPPYNGDLALAKIGVGIVCHDTPENRVFASAFDQLLGRMIETGAYQGLFEDAGVPLRFLPGAQD